jgi:hypothetical protein
MARAKARTEREPLDLLLLRGEEEQTEVNPGWLLPLIRKRTATLVE